MPLIKLGIKGLAKYMTSGSAAQRKVLWDSKNPDPEGQAQAKYYREARNSIVKFHRDGNDVTWLESQSAALLVGAQNAPNQQTKARMKNNARGIQHYADNFGDIEYEILADVTRALTFGNVQITVSPDMHVRDDGKEKLLKLDFAEKQPENDVIKIITQGMFEAATTEGMGLPSSQIIYVDVPRGVRHKAARLGARMRQNIVAAYQNIEAIWPTV